MTVTKPKEVDIGETLEYMKRRAPKRYKVLQAMMQGKHDREIAEHFKIDQAVVRTHISLICKDFGIQGKRRAKRTELMSKLSGHNYIDVKDFIVKRQPIESKLKDILERTGSIAVVESSQKMGKTTLIHQVLESINCDNYEVIQLNVKLLLNPDYETFLRSFCSIVGKHLNLENRLDEYWSDGIAPNYNVTDYFEKYLLGEIEKPIILILDNIEQVFHESDFMGNFEWKTDFCWLIRGWYDSSQSKIDDNNPWRRFRLVLANCTDVYAGLDINASPLAAIGEVIEIPEFSPKEIEKLAKSYNLKWQPEQVAVFMELVGGHPYLVKTLLDYISSEDLDFLEMEQPQQLEKLGSIFNNHLSQYRNLFQEFPAVKKAYSQVISANKPKEISDAKVEFKLNCLGLIKRQGKGWVCPCELYNYYFS